MIEVSNSRQEPAGWVDNFGNFERVAQDWMEEEPGTTWRPVFFEATPPRDGLTHQPGATMCKCTKTQTLIRTEKHCDRIVSVYSDGRRVTNFLPHCA